MTIKVRPRNPVTRIFLHSFPLKPEHRSYLFDLKAVYPDLRVAEYNQSVKVLPPKVENDGTVIDRIEHTVADKTVIREGSTAINEPRITGKKLGVEIEIVSVPPEKPRFWRRSPER